MNDRYAIINSSISNCLANYILRKTIVLNFMGNTCVSPNQINSFKSYREGVQPTRTVQNLLSLNCMKLNFLLPEKMES